MSQTVFSGIRPTAESTHLGNYFGAVINWVALQERYDCLYCLVDYHAITEPFDPQRLPERVLSLAADLLACGVDPERSILFVQSAVPEHTELAWIFNCVTAYGDLQRMTQFKDKSEGKAFVSAGLFNYPVLMAADILLYHATVVPVGDDQDQHVELTRRIARRFNSRFGPTFAEPETLHTPAPRIMSLADPHLKMSKSLGDKHVVGLFEDEASIRRKVQSAVTDTGPRGEEMSPGVANLFTLLRLSAPEEVFADFQTRYRAGTLKYVALKEAVSEHLLAHLAPIRRRRRELEPAEVRRVLERGVERARERAARTVRRVKERIGVWT